jgi:hypothetical protein
MAFDAEIVVLFTPTFRFFGGGVGWTKKIIECEEKDFLSTFRQAAQRKSRGLKVAVSRKIKPSLLQSRRSSALGSPSARACNCPPAAHPAKSVCVRKLHGAH